MKLSVSFVGEIFPTIWYNLKMKILCRFEDKDILPSNYTKIKEKVTSNHNHLLLRVYKGLMLKFLNN